MLWGGGRWKETKAMSTGQEKREEEEEAVSGGRRETCHRLGYGSAADAAFVGCAETGGWTGPPGRRAGEEGGGTRDERGAQSHPGRSLLPGEETFSGRRKLFPARAESGAEASCGCARLEVTHPGDPEG